MMAKIAVVYNVYRGPLKLIDMSYIRWIKISEALAKLGHKVDITTNEPRWSTWWKRKSPIHMNENLRRIPISKVTWSQYDIVKTLFHEGFEALEKFNGTNHSFIISKLGSVVGPRDLDGIYFYGKYREKLYRCQERIATHSKYITVLNEQAKELWIECHGSKDNFLVVPGGVDSVIPQAVSNPYSGAKKKVSIFAGSVYNKFSQPEANAVLISKLNELGQYLAKQNVRLYMIGSGDVSNLNKQYVTYLGAIPYEKSWDYLHFADVGIVVSAGKFMHNNESSKIYHYLRTGLPSVIEAGFPNDDVVRESRLGFVVENGNMALMAEKVGEAAGKNWNREYAIDYILNYHTWDKRAEVYNRIIKEHIRN